MQVIDRITHDIQQRLEQLLDEADKLRHALAALDPRGRHAAPAAQAAKPQPQAKRPAARKVTSPKQTVAPKRTVSPSGSTKPARTAPGETKAKVLGALSRGHALTAGEVAQATGLARPTVSTTLSKLAKSGEAAKAPRGYVLPGEAAASANGTEPSASSVSTEG